MRLLARLGVATQPTSMSFSVRDDRQAITINDQRYDEYRRSVDFIQRHIFPGALLPSLGRVLESLWDATDLWLSGLESTIGYYQLLFAKPRHREGMFAAGAGGRP